MKKLNLFLLVAGFFVFSSCSGILENQDVQQKAGNVIIKINDSSSSARFISPVQSFDISQVEKWTLNFTPITPVGLKEEKFILQNGQNSVTLGVGTYSLYMEGSYKISNANGGSSTVKLSGTKTNITVTEGNTTQVAVAVGLKKSPKGTGALAIGFKFDVDSWNEYYTDYGNMNDYKQGIKILLISKDDNKTEYSTEDGYLKIQSVNEQSNPQTINVSTTKLIPAGYYYIEFYAYYSKNENSDQDTEPVWRKVVLNTDNLVEIADAQETIGDFVNLNFPNTVTKYVYYASKNGSTESNGLSETNPGNLYTILENIYANKAVSIAKINYKYPDSDKMEFDVSKVQSGKQVTISYKKGDVGDSDSFTIDEAGLITFNIMNEELSLITTNDKVKSFNVKSIVPRKICLNNGVYLDFSSFVDIQQSPNIYFDVDDVEYYENHPMVVSSKCFSEKPSFFSSDSSHFTYDIVEKENSADSSYKYYAEEPVSPIVYYSNKYSQGSSVVQYWIQYKENPLYGDNPPSYSNNNFSLAAFCDDYNGGLYAFEFELEGDTNNKVPNDLTDSSGYKLVHFVRKKTDKSTEFTLEKIPTGYIKQQIPASMCTDGSRLYFVNTAATISKKNGQELLLSSWDHWAYENAIVYSVVAGNSGQSASEVQLNFDSVFTKVTAVYCQGINKDLYIAGYKTNQNGSTNKGSTYCIYKLANPQNYTTNCSIKAKELTKVSKLFTTSEDSSFIDWYSTQATQNVYAFNAITDMAIIDNNLYVLKNSYYFANADTTKITSSLIRINNNGQIGKTWSTAGDNTFMVARKFIAVLPKKKKLLISENASSCYYTADFSKDDLDITMTTGSGYVFDGYDITPTGFISGENFKSEADVIENVSSN